MKLSSKYKVLQAYIDLIDRLNSHRPQSFRHQRRPVNNCVPGRGGMAQNGGKGGGTFHGEMNRCRGSQGWTTVCSRMPERDGKAIYSPKQAAGSCWFARLSHKWRELVSSGRLVCRCHDVFSGVTFVLFCFRLYDFVEAAALRSTVLRYAGAPIATRVSFFFFISFIWRLMSLFPSIFSYHCRFLFEWRVRRTVRSFLPDGV